MISFLLRSYDFILHSLILWVRSFSFWFQPFNLPSFSIILVANLISFLTILCYEDDRVSNIDFIPLLSVYLLYILVGISCYEYGLCGSRPISTAWLSELIWTISNPWFSGNYLVNLVVLIAICLWFTETGCNNYIYIFIHLYQSNDYIDQSAELGSTIFID